jgi:[acyl-carrier-protein] S-malonyltransferase
MGKVGLIFPGQGSQSVGMGKDLDASYPIAKKVFEDANAAVGFDLAKLCFEGPEEILTLTTNAQPAIVTTSIAALRVLQKRAEFEAAFVAGHSLGEYSALVCAEALDFSDAVRTVRKRGEFMQAAVPVGTGAMAAIIGLDLKEVEALCQQVNTEANVVTLANLNSPGQYVISGHTQAVNDVIALAKEKGAKRAILLAVSAPFHCALMRPAAEHLEKVLHSMHFRNLTIPLINNAEASIMTSGEAARDALVRQMYKSVQWERTIRLMLARGVATFIEVGPGKVLSGLLKRIDKNANGLNVYDVETLEKVIQALKE